MMAEGKKIFITVFVLVNSDDFISTKNKVL
jgi:hypothetical protein